MTQTCRFLFGLANCLVPIARIIVVELLGPKRAVIGIAVLPGENSVVRVNPPHVDNAPELPRLRDDRGSPAYRTDRKIS